MNFAGLTKQSLVDYPGQIAAVLFTWECNMRCPFCHNGHLLSTKNNNNRQDLESEEIMEFLQERKGFLDAVVISGGEPTLHSELPQFIKIIKEISYLVKLDTNGTNPLMLQQLLQDRVLDYVAMDIKAPVEYKDYLKACGRLTVEDFFNVRNSIQILLDAEINTEFRTTVVPGLHTPADIESIARYLKGSRLYTLQQFNPTNTLNRSYGNIVPYSRPILEKIAQKCAQYVEKVKIINA